MSGASGWGLIEMETTYFIGIFLGLILAVPIFSE
jgi:hypothetical protein